MRGSVEIFISHLHFPRFWVCANVVSRPKAWRFEKVFFNLITRQDFYHDHITGMSDNFNEFIKLLNLVKYKISALNQVSYVIERFNLTGNLQTSLSQDSETKSSQLSSSTVFLVFHYFPTSKHEKDVNL